MVQQEEVPRQASQPAKLQQPVGKAGRNGKKGKHAKQQQQLQSIQTAAIKPEAAPVPTQPEHKLVETATEEAYDSQPQKKSYNIIYIGIAAAVLIVAGLYFVFAGGDQAADGQTTEQTAQTGTEGTPTVDKATAEAANVQALRNYATNKDPNITHYVLIDVDGDGIREAIAVTSKKLIVFAYAQGASKLLIEKKVSSWAWSAYNGFFVWAGSGNSGSGTWQKVENGKLVMNNDAISYRYSGNNYYKIKGDKEIPITEGVYNNELDKIGKNKAYTAFLKEKIAL